MVRKQINTGESKTEKFKRLSEKRMNKILKDVSVLGNLASPSYEYEAEQVAKMKEIVQEQVDHTFSLFGGKKKPEGFHW